MGRLPVRPLVSARAQAGLAAAVLAGSAAVPAVAAATPPVPEEETSAEGTQDPGDGTLPDIDGTDPGVGSGVNTPVADEPAAGFSPTEGDDDSGPLEPSVPDDGGDDDSPPPGADVAPQEPEPVGAAPIAAPPAPAPPAPATPAQPAPATEVADEPAKKRPPEKRRDPASAPRVAPAPQVPAAPQAPAESSPAATATAAAVAPAAAPSNAQPAKGERYHVVQAGESLWAIAHERLGAGATPAEIAREVERIWDLNADAIGTGDPDLLMAGQKLRLR